jgi:hypothetical protein
MNPFNYLLEVSQRWESNPTYAQIIIIGKSVADGATPNKADTIIDDVLSLYSDVSLLHGAIPSDDVFYIVSAYAYYTDDRLITMTQLAQGLAIARINNADYFDLSADMPNPTKPQRTKASQWVLSHRIRTYQKPHTNKSQANQVLYGDVIEALGNE